MKHSNADEIREWLTVRLSEILNIQPDQINPDEQFPNYGLTSIAAVCLAGDLERWLKRPMSPMLTYDHPTITLLSQHLAND
jgi:acyl carrier protein